MTISKSQGQSLGRVGLYLPRPVFGHGQLYVALSRSGNPPAGRLGVRIVAVDTEDGVQGRHDTPCRGSTPGTWCTARCCSNCY